MAFFKRLDAGRVYVIRMTLPDGVIIHKIGMCKSNRSTDRMLEILRSWFMKFRFIPYSCLLLDMETAIPRELEAHIHKILKKNKLLPDRGISGSTEMFIDIDEFRVVHYLRHCRNDMADCFGKLTEDDYKHLGQLFTL